MRYGDFTTLTRQITVEEPLTEVGDIYRLGCFLLGREKLVSRPLRLLGLGVASLREPAAKQLVLLRIGFGRQSHLLLPSQSLVNRFTHHR